MSTKTIIITALGGKGPVTFRPAPGQKAPTTLVLGKRPAPHQPTPPIKAQVEMVTGGGAPPRKRERLTHLSPEEKLNRRKLKNRIAAQTARDRKKAKMHTLEETTGYMEAEMDALQAENEALRAGYQRLEEENAKLRAQLATKPITVETTLVTETKPKTEVIEEGEAGLTLGSAASINAPLQWDQVSLPRHLATPSASLLIQLLSSLLSLSSPTSSPTTRLPSRARLEEMLATLHKGLPLSSAQTADLMAIWRLRRRPPEPPP